MVVNPRGPSTGWVKPDKTLIVAAAPRSGGHFLCQLMQATGQLGAPDEYFNAAAIAKFLPGTEPTIANCCRLVMERGCSPNGVAGIRMFPEHFEWLEGSIRLSEWFGVPRWIWLQRHDLLGQAISLAIAKQDEQFTSSLEAKKEADYSAREIAFALDGVVRRQARWAAYFARTGIEPLTVWYEEVDSDPEAALVRIGAFAGETLPASGMKPGDRFRKQRGSRNDEWRRRFLAEMGDADRISVDFRSSSTRRGLAGWLRQLLKR